MRISRSKTPFFALAGLVLVCGTGLGQNINATITGTVTDPTGASVPGAQLALTSIATGTVAKATTNPDGLFRFPNLQAGAYELKAGASGFRDFVQKGITVNINDTVRVDIRLDVGTAEQTVEVTADASPLNVENAE